MSAAIRSLGLVGSGGLLLTTAVIAAAPAHAGLGPYCPAGSPSIEACIGGNQSVDGKQFTIYGYVYDNTASTNIHGSVHVYSSANTDLQDCSVNLTPGKNMACAYDLGVNGHSYYAIFYRADGNDYRSPTAVISD